jgi:succinyl-CoA synthetase alpha subunit
MSILVQRDTRVVVQGITGRDGGFHTRHMLDYGTRVVAGVTPGKGGTEVHGVPVFDSVDQAVRERGADASVVYVPPLAAADAICEAVDAGIRFVVCITEGVPVQDMLRTLPFVRDHGARLLGPNCPGLIVPGQAKLGILPGNIVTPGPIGVISRSGTLTYEVVDQLTRGGIGQSACIGIGGDPLIGTRFVDLLGLFEADPDTEAVVLIGEIGGTDEEEAAAFIGSSMRKPVVGFIAGRTAPPGRRMGHAGAIVSGGAGTAAEKVAALQAVGVRVAATPGGVVGELGSVWRAGRAIA